MIARIACKYLYDDDDIRDVVGSQIYASQAPQGATGAMLILRPQQVNRFYHLTNEVALYQPSVQIDCYHRTDSDAWHLHELVRNRLSGVVAASVEWMHPDGTATTTVIQEATITAPEGMYTQEPGDGSDEYNHRYTTTYQLSVAQPAPTHA